jgi:hypothetical protein
MGGANHFPWGKYLPLPSKQYHDASMWSEQCVGWWLNAFLSLKLEWESLVSLVSRHRFVLFGDEDIYLCFLLSRRFTLPPALRNGRSLDSFSYVSPSRDARVAPRALRPHDAHPRAPNVRSQPVDSACILLGMALCTCINICTGDEYNCIVVIPWIYRLFTSFIDTVIDQGPVWYSFMSGFTSSFTTSIAKQPALCPALWSASLKTLSHSWAHGEAAKTWLSPAHEVAHEVVF